MKTLRRIESGIKNALRRFTALVVFVLVGIIPAIAFAAEDTAVQKLSDQLMSILTPVIVAFVGALFTWLLVLFQKKTGIKIEDDKVNAWSNIARKAALRGAEWARKEAKKRGAGVKIPGPEILEVSAKWAIDMGAQSKLPQMAKDALEGLIEAHLFELRMEEFEIKKDAPPIVGDLPKV
jgi:hypothetical protein